MIQFPILFLLNSFKKTLTIVFQIVRVFTFLEYETMDKISKIIEDAIKRDCKINLKQIIKEEKQKELLKGQIK